MTFIYSITAITYGITKAKSVIDELLFLETSGKLNFRATSGCFCVTTNRLRKYSDYSEMVAQPVKEAVLLSCDREIKALSGNYRCEA